MNNDFSSYQININLGVSDGSTTSVAPNDPLLARLGRHFSDQINGEVWVHVLRPVDEPHQSVVVRLPFLKKSKDYLRLCKIGRLCRYVTGTNLARVRLLLLWDPVGLVASQAAGR